MKIDVLKVLNYGVDWWCLIEGEADTEYLRQ